MTTPAEMRAEAERLNARAQELETQLTDADVERMFKERRYAEIDQASQDGRIDHAQGA